MRRLQSLTLVMIFLLTACSSTSGIEVPEQTGVANKPPVIQVPSVIPVATATPTSTSSPIPKITVTPTPNGGGGYITFQVIPYKSKGAGVAVVNSDGSHLDEGTEYFLSPNWIKMFGVSPDGRKVAYISDYGYSGTGHLFVTNYDGSNKQEIGYSTDFSWSPDSNRIIFNWVDEGGKWTLFIVDVQSGEIRRFIDLDLNIYGGKWSPDGNQFAFVATSKDNDDDYEIYFASTDGNNVHQFTNNDADESGIKWSPDGRLFAYESRFEGKSELHIAELNGGDSNKIFEQEAYISCITWSPNSKQILFVSRQEGNSEIYIINSDGTDFKNLTHHEANDGCASWSPDGTQIVFSADRDRTDLWSHEIYIMRADGSNVRQLTDDENSKRDPIWQLFAE